MPVCLRPNKTFLFALEGDASIPLATRPHFVARYVTCGQRMEMAEVIDAAKSLKDSKKLHAVMDEQLKSLIVGLCSFPKEMDLEKLLPELTWSEKWELIYGILNGNELKADEIKNSV
jgi:hypothetical protein